MCTHQKRFMQQKATGKSHSLQHDFKEEECTVAHTYRTLTQTEGPQTKPKRNHTHLSVTGCVHLHDFLHWGPQGSGPAGCPKPGAQLNNLPALRTSLQTAYMPLPPGNWGAPLEPPPHPAVDWQLLLYLWAGEGGTHRWDMEDNKGVTWVTFSWGWDVWNAINTAFILVLISSYLTWI